MACSLNCSFYLSAFDEIAVCSKTKRVSGFCPSVGLQFHRDSNFMGKPLVVSDQEGSRDWRVNKPNNFSVNAQASICISRAMRWWEKTLKPNMVEIHSAGELVNSLIDAGDRLAIIDFYSPGCGGCKALHPKICQLAEQNPDAIFLKVNYEELKPMCHALNIHVLPFFRFYRGAEGKVSSFSCTNATIKKFKDALAKHGTDRCGLGPARGLEESELLKLASIGEISRDLPFPSIQRERMEDLVVGGMGLMKV
ncbi:hypothetical protein UlMin_008289 [Ulmus minor]